MVERLGEMRKGRRERVEKGKRERIEKGSREGIIDKRERDKMQFEVRDPPFIEFSRSDLGVQASKFGFYKLIEYIILKICHGVKQNAKICAIGETECNET